ncbi:hypothetical protein BGZ58_000513 [Dissophora ornata]|nr:hypothetical protein BGZ58_000513 [Dissophora ornata]
MPPAQGSSAANYTKDTEGKKAQAQGAARNLNPGLAAVMFPKVVQVNNDMLGGFARRSKWESPPRVFFGIATLKTGPN